MPAASEAPAPRVAEPITVTAPKLDRAIAEQTREYWLGTMPDSPRANYTIAGVEFPRYSGNVNFGEDGQPDYPLNIGAKRHLTDSQVAAIKKDVLHFVVRRRAKANEDRPWESVVMGDVLDVRGADPKTAPHDKEGTPVLTYRKPSSHEDQDTPFGCFLFLYRVETGVPLPEVPAPMVARAEAVASA